ncbi:MAG TPA: hydrogenase expression protein HypE [Alphaproteobacteria bacterium]|nr:hydrogenase expression protein HypE [Alphaproteobacteria bacterium]
MTTSLAALIEAGQRPPYATAWPRASVDAATWGTAGAELAAGRWTLLGLWGEPDAVHLALRDAAGFTGILTFACPAGTFPSIGAHHPPAIRPERAIRDLFGLEPAGLPDGRPWLDHGKWKVRTPLAISPAPAEARPPYGFLPAAGENLHQIPVGPIHAGIIEPGHFRFTASGETVVRLEQRLGYTHKGIEFLLRGADLERGSRLAGRTSGDSTVAYQLAFARAVEAALGAEVPERAVWLRALMAELERLANHFGDIGAICNDASFALMHTYTGMLREEVLRASDTAFGHRLLRDRIVPGGLGRDIAPEGIAAIRALVDLARRRFRRLVRLYDNTASLQDRTVGAGIAKAELVRQFAAGGYVGRASGRAFDARKAMPYAPYDQLTFEVPVREEGDVNARIWIRILEVEQSLSLVEQILDRLPAGAVHRLPAPTGEPREGAALVEGFRGDILVWLRLGADGAIARCHLRDPSWFQWPLLEAAIEGNIVADFPLCNKSFNCSYSGHDL